MSPVDLAAAGIALLLTLAVGTVVHEFAHALALDAFAIPYEIVWLPAGDDGYHTLFLGALASVRPQRAACSPWGLRIAAMMPLVMTLPIALALAGIVPDPTDGPVGTTIVVGWLACSLPSPQDFSLCWYADRTLEEYE